MTLSFHIWLSYKFSSEIDLANHHMVSSTEYISGEMDSLYGHLHWPVLV